MIKRIHVMEIPKELYSEGYDLLEFEVVCSKGDIYGPYILKLRDCNNQQYIIDNLYINREEAIPAMRDFLKSITFQLGGRRDPICDVYNGAFKYDFKFIKNYYGLDTKYTHDDNICRFVDEQPCEEE